MNISNKSLLSDRSFTLGLTIVVAGIITGIVYPSQFLSIDNFSQIFLNISIDSIVAVGMMLLMIGGMFDLSVGSVVAFSGGIAGYCMYYHGMPIIPSCLIALLSAILVGIINGVLIAKVGINPLIQTLAMMGVVRGLTLIVSGSGIQNLPYEFSYISQSKFLGLYTPIWYMFIVVGVFGLLAIKLPFFRQYYFLGSNERASFLSGIRVDKLKIWGFMISAGLAGLAGIILASRLGASLSTSGQGTELRVITAVILGGASLSGGYGKIWGAFMGVAFMGIINNALIIGRVSGYWQEVILGVILIIAVGLDKLLVKE